MVNYNLNSYSKPMDVTAEQFYIDTVRPLFKDVILKINTDPELIRSAKKAVNALDSYCVRGQLKEIESVLNPIYSVISQDAYLKTGSMKNGTLDEKNLVATLNESIKDLLLIVKHDASVQNKKAPKERPIIRERIGYDEKAMANTDYTRTIAELNRTTPKEITITEEEQND